MTAYPASAEDVATKSKMSHKDRMETYNTRTTEKRSFSFADKKGRIIGGAMTTWVEVWSPITEGEDLSGHTLLRRPAGTYYVAEPRALRNGIFYAASQPEQRFATEAERDAYVAKYWREAEKRAAKLAGN